MPQYVHLTDTITGPISVVTLNNGDASANIPLKQYAFFVQDDWAVSDKLTLNLGLRYDLITGYQFDQSKNPNFVKVQEAGRAGQLAGIKGMENFGQDPKDDTNNWQPRLGFAYDVRGNGKDVIRGGWGVYMDMAYTNANALFPAIDATGVGFGAVLSVDNQQGIRNPDGSLFQVGQPLTNIRESLFGFERRASRSRSVGSIEIEGALDQKAGVVHLAVEACRRQVIDKDRLGSLAKQVDLPELSDGKLLEPAEALAAGRCCSCGAEAPTER